MIDIKSFFISKMNHDLLIVESPSKIKKIQNYVNALGLNIKVSACFGHFRDLPKKKLSVDVDNNFQPEYKITTGKKKIVNELKSSAKHSNVVWLASDKDREGESIAWHLSKVLNLTNLNSNRVVFTEITKKAIKNAIEHPKELDMDMFYSQQARRILDRLIGYLITPILWKHFQNSYKKDVSLSAGRVQSVVVKLVKDREDEIKNFESERYFKITAIFDTQLKAELATTFKTSDKTIEFLNHCKDSTFIIDSIKSKKTRRNPSAPFITSTLQQEASVKYGFSPKKTMLIAQKLYENGFITYMRTDSLNLSEDALQMIKNEVIKTFGEDYYKYRVYNKKVKNSQEAHEAIRPCFMNKHNILEENGMNLDESKIYKLIWNRTMATQMAPAKVKIMTLKISISDRQEIFIAKGETILFDGFLKVYKKVNTDSSEDEESDSNELELFKSYNKGQEVFYTNINASEKVTKPPHGHYSEASLVKHLEKLGIGRPSTYSSIISTVQSRKYVKLDSRKGNQITLNVYTLNSDDIKMGEIKQYINTAQKKLFITDTGSLITNFLNKHFDNIMDYNFTANIETMLDEIAAGNKVWHEVVRYFYNQFHPKTLILNSIDSPVEKERHKRLLGKDPKSGCDIIVYIGKYGPVACICNENKKHCYASLNNLKIDEITLEQALKLFEYPKDIGEYKGNVVKLNKGRYGFYLKCNGKNYSLKNIKTFDETLDESTLDIANIIETYKTNTNIIKKINDDIVIRTGKYGPYINYKKKTNVKIWGSKKPEDLTLEDCMKLIKKKKIFKKR